MSSTTTTTQFLPSLLDRLQGDVAGPRAPRQPIDMAGFKDQVVRDIARVLDQPRLLFPVSLVDGVAAAEAGPARYPNIAESVLNYGVYLPFGNAVSPDVLEHIRLGIARAVETFEPRASNIRVVLQRDGQAAEETAAPAPAGQTSTSGRPVYIIQADIRTEPFAEPVSLTAEVDLISGECQLL